LNFVATEDERSHFDGRIVLHCFGSLCFVTTWDRIRLFCALIHRYLETEAESWNIVSPNVHFTFIQLFLLVWVCCQTRGARNKHKMIWLSLLPLAPLFHANPLFYALLEVNRFELRACSLKTLSAAGLWKNGGKRSGPTDGWGLATKSRGLTWETPLNIGIEFSQCVLWNIDFNGWFCDEPRNGERTDSLSDAGLGLSLADWRDWPHELEQNGCSFHNSTSREKSIGLAIQKVRPFPLPLQKVTLRKKFL
jgi:hypothetical protein